MRLAHLWNGVMSLRDRDLRLGDISRPAFPGDGVSDSPFLRE
jgi:hypothetical protein